ncbi:M14 family metallopeptidase [Marixanthomonas spongiae]|uniref:Zinc carboxypeptidase n=1 Tax=Marixanthomonas spongiae TaxID=2174845 RepID=A0A2U0HXI5_9FLAO|nr:M14 family metallopeptidase [Marixanthomonas spongiae]PVW13546.1 zinc carboxypeptidase [Marixanthomonas spongiae]
MTTRFTLLFLFISAISLAQLQSPSEFLGYPLGTQFTRNADVVDYFEHVAKNSSMVTYQPYGKTYERRTLSYAVISSEENIKNLETIRLNNLKSIGLQPGTASPETAIVWLSYNVHGNEASSTEAAMNTLYTLITEKQSWLQNTVVIMDPSVNPDGRDRYVNWYNQVKATPYNPAQDATEHHEPWPGGRPNHYLFDLNRDWAWASQVETRQRLKVYNQWMPHVHVDFHEQGINEPYYFAPAAEPFHEIITPFQREFQTKIGKNNARYFDEEGWLFFTRERFDLLYPSYGDTYPIYMGAIGMTYEQAGHGRAGLGINTDEGFELTLKDRLTHHTTTGLSTIEVAANNAAALTSEFKQFFTPSNSKYKSYVLTGNADNIHALTELLDTHDITYGFKNNGSVSGYHYANGEQGTIKADPALVVSTNQPKGRMVEVLFEPKTKLSTPVTYDITAWSLPYAYGLDAVASTSLVSATANLPATFKSNAPALNAAGYIAKWDSMDDAAFLADLLKHDIRVRFSEKKLRFNGNTFDRGSLIITRSDNKSNKEFDTTVTQLANKHKRNLYASNTSFADTMTDFGSPDVKLINKQRIAVLQGEGTSSLSYGAIWHFFEQQLHYPVTAINTDDIGTINLTNYDVLVMPDGWYGHILNDDTFTKLEDWVRKGGKVIAIGQAVSQFEGKDGFALQHTKNDAAEENGAATPNDNLTPYDQREQENTKNMITGSIFKVTMDPSHPMAFGYGDTYFSLKLGSSAYGFLDSGYNVGYIKGEATNVSGFAGADAKKGLANSLVFGEDRVGNGSVVYLVDDVLFRSFWQNGKLLFVNSLFFVNNNAFTL